MKNIAIYPGSFDPPTNGHLDIVERALTIFEHLIIVVITNPDKKTLFTLEERKEMLEKICSEFTNVEIANYEGLIVDFAKQKNATTIIRGLRMVSDFEYEFQMALMNRKLNPNIKSVYLMPSPEFSYLSSSLIKEVYSLGGSIKDFIPVIVEEYLSKKLSGGKE
ncbi:pantetheine-phosphate adenylyltransferase [Elusimicrobiota bacterium]